MSRAPRTPAAPGTPDPTGAAGIQSPGAVTPPSDAQVAAAAAELARAAAEAGETDEQTSEEDKNVGAQESRSAPDRMGMADFASIIAGAVAQAVATALAAVGIKKEDDTPPPPDPQEVQNELAQQLAETRYLITIQRGEKDSVDPVPVGVNGILRTIKRGEYAVITQSMLEVLENSQEQKIDPETREPYWVTSYPYTVVRELTREDWDLSIVELRQKYMPDRNRLN